MISLKYIDIFDEKFNFYTGYQPSFHTILGGIMTLFFILLSIVVSIFFEYDDIFKLNPISSKSEINYGNDNSKENLEKGKIWIPWRIAKYGHQFLDHRGILYPKIYSVKGKKNKYGEMDLEYKELKYKLCNETSMANKPENYIIDVNLNELFCIDDEFSEIGGSWDNEELDYIKINLYLCEDGVIFNVSDPKCQNFNNLLINNNNSWLFEFYYPLVQFQPTNKKVPMLVVYKSYYYILSNYANIIERLYLKRNILSDDQNIINNNPKNFTYWGMSDLYGDSYFLPSEFDPLLKSTGSSQLYSFIIYKDQGLVYYTRSYKKIITIISDIFPILNIIFMAFQKITGKIKSSLLKRNLMELMFEIDNETTILKKEINFNKKIQTKIPKINSLPVKNSLKKQQLNTDLLHKRKSIDLVNSFKDEIINDKSSQLMYLNKINNNFSKCIDLNEVQNKNKKIIKQLIKFPITNEDCEIRFNNSKIIKIAKALNINSSDINHINLRKKLFPLYYYFMDVILDITNQPKKFCVVTHQYLTVYNFMSQLYDISTYVLLYKQFNIIKKALYFKYYGCFSESKKINILNEEIMNIIDESLKKKKNVIFSDELLINS